MKIKKLTHQNILDVKTVIHDKKYHNVKHGIKGKHMWEWSLCLDNTLFPVKDNECILLNNDNYILAPAYKKNTILKDNIGNIVYNLKTCDMDFHKSEIILLWELPIKNFVDVKYKIKGFVSELGKGYIGKFRNNSTIKVPSPVLEITGDSVLTWTGTTDNGDVYEQTVTYSNSNWDIEPPKLI